MWIGIVIAVYLISTGCFFLVYKRKEKYALKGSESHTSFLGKEKKAKQKMLSDLALSSQKLASFEEAKGLVETRDDLLLNIEKEKKYLLSIQEKVEKFERRIAELSALKKELQVSSDDVMKEVEMLRSQEAEIQAQGAAIREQIKSVREKLIELRKTLLKMPELVSRIDSADSGLKSAEERSDFFEQEIAAINKNYLILKKAYDSLDIDYAQLYEKQQKA